MCFALDKTYNQVSVNDFDFFEKLGQVSHFAAVCMDIILVSPVYLTAVVCIYREPSEWYLMYASVQLMNGLR